MNANVRDYIDVPKLVALTRKLVNISSATGNEKAIAEFYASELQSIGMKVRLQEVERDRYNVIGELEGNGRGVKLMFCGHFDTSTSGKEELFGGKLTADAYEEDGWIYGLGVSNMKNALAAYICAVEALMKTGVKLRGDIIISGVVGETERAPVGDYKGSEYRGGGIGARYMMNHGVTADCCVIGEPTGMRLAIGCTGYIFARITTLGVPQHTWSKEYGIDAIEKMISVREALKNWEVSYAAKYRHPLMTPRIGIGAIEGGYPFKPSICPAPYCNLYVDIRTIPGVKPIAIREEIEDLLYSLSKKDPELKWELDFYYATDGYEISQDELVVSTISKAYKEVLREEIPYVAPSRYNVSCDGIVISAYGVPTITFGAGGVRPSGILSNYDVEKGESVSIDNLINCTAVFAYTALNICSREKAEMRLDA